MLLSDVLGASMQAIAINNEAYENATEATDEDRAAQDGEQAGDAASRSDVNGRVTTPGT